MPIQQVSRTCRKTDGSWWRIVHGALTDSELVHTPIQPSVGILSSSLSRNDPGYAGSAELLSATLENWSLSTLEK